MKRILLLGGSRYALPVIKAAHELGYYIITADYLPNNIAHKYSDAYCNVSIIDKEAVLRTAVDLKIDGIMSFGCDPGVVTAAYVAEKLGLPSVGSYDSVSILQNKGKFRKFLSDNGFNVPTARCYTSKDVALQDINIFNWPVIVKPTDSAGSKGVTRVDDPKDLSYALDYALEKSLSKEFIIEDFLEKVGCSSDTDSFTINGELAFVSFNAQHFDLSAPNPYAPAAYCWPSTMTSVHEEELKSEIQRLMKLLGLKTSIYNIETRECTDGKAYIMECSPRGGGNRLAEMIRYATGIDMIKAAVLAAVGEEIKDIEQKPYNDYWSIIILHSEKSGEFGGVWINGEINDNIVEKDLWIEKGDFVEKFVAANDAIGTLVLRFSDEKKMANVLNNIKDYVQIIIK